VCCCRFIGELYKVGLLKEKFVHYSFDDLLPQDQVCLPLLHYTAISTVVAAATATTVGLDCVGCS
jgi:hypothetical protein